MRYDFDHVPDRRPTDSVKWNKFQVDVLPLWVADMDYCAAEPIQRALRARIEHGVYGYPDTHGDLCLISELRQVLVERMYKLYDWQISPDDLVFLPGVITGLNLACQCSSRTERECAGANTCLPTVPYYGSKRGNGTRRCRAGTTQ